MRCNVSSPLVRHLQWRLLERRLQFAFTGLDMTVAKHDIQRSGWFAESSICDGKRLEGNVTLFSS